MSRSGYHDDMDDPLQLGRWRAQVRSATRGKRGQKLLRDMLVAVDAMPEKRLVPFELEVSSEADAKHATQWAAVLNRDPAEYFTVAKNDRPAYVRDGDVCALGWPPASSVNR